MGLPGVISFHPCAWEVMGRWGESCFFLGPHLVGFLILDLSSKMSWDVDCSIHNAR